MTRGLRASEFSLSGDPSRFRPGRAGVGPERAGFGCFRGGEREGFLREGFIGGGGRETKKWSFRQSWELSTAVPIEAVRLPLERSKARRGLFAL